MKNQILTSILTSAVILTTAAPAEAKISKKLYKAWRPAYWLFMVSGVVIGGPGAVITAVTQHADEKLAEEAGVDKEY